MGRFFATDAEAVARFLQALEIAVAPVGGLDDVRACAEHSHNAGVESDPPVVVAVEQRAHVVEQVHVRICQIRGQIDADPGRLGQLEAISLRRPIWAELGLAAEVRPDRLGVERLFQNAEVNHLVAAADDAQRELE